MLKYMLDTNMVIYTIKRRPLELLDVFNRHDDQMAISTITLSELLHGVEKSADSKRNRSKVERFITRLVVLDYGRKASAHYGDIRADLERKGTPIGVNDLHIAGHSRSEGLVLVTNNRKEFDRVEGLRVENWLDQIEL
ncbi:type II toxin-antitoxin system tRNA(fMet)-specific endonuclease VapC [Endozoicomonas numazuensis]|uniref:Ribonuclease VapC n=1 Tax=Endozoicomonas numazuensis TaxID=1137799 RepID=A0A081NJA4_9GAMM|nr:tRNA(fMet)-specific endonuclease VapC [Endozoicomonas numazuensis]KEQ18527.1 plasmid maintenance protein [Endozoicomonas numazuensis]